MCHQSFSQQSIQLKLKIHSEPGIFCATWSREKNSQKNFENEFVNFHLLSDLVTTIEKLLQKHADDSSTLFTTAAAGCRRQVVDEIGEWMKIVVG